MYVFRLTTWYWVVIRVLTLAEDHSPSLYHCSLLVALHLDVGPCKMTPIHIGMPVDFIIVWVLFRQPCCEDFMGQLPYHIEKTLSVHFLVHWLLQTFDPSSLMFQRSIYRGHSNLQLSRLLPS